MPIHDVMRPHVCCIRANVAKFRRLGLLICLISFAGCSSTRTPVPLQDLHLPESAVDAAITTASTPTVSQDAQSLSNAKPLPTTLTLPDLIQATVERNPRLAQVAWAVETARGR